MTGQILDADGAGASDGCEFNQEIHPLNPLARRAPKATVNDDAIAQVRRRPPTGRADPAPRQPNGGNPLSVGFCSVAKGGPLVALGGLRRAQSRDRRRHPWRLTGTRTTWRGSRARRRTTWLTQPAAHLGRVAPDEAARGAGTSSHRASRDCANQCIRRTRHVFLIQI